ncbi:MAG: hypothetical protein JXN10_03240, partial [Clostridia bacterium]|nr:hypothetical protein [Clostridia bacterium]
QRYINHRRTIDEQNYLVSLQIEYPVGTVSAMYMPSGGQWTDYIDPLILSEDTYISTRASDAEGDTINGGVQITVPVKPDAIIQEGPILISGRISNTGMTGLHQVLLRTLDENKNVLSQTGQNNLDLQPGTTDYTFTADMDLPKNTAYSFLMYIDLNRNDVYDIGEAYARADDFYFAEGTSLNFDFSQWNSTGLEIETTAIIFDHTFDIGEGKVFMTIEYPSGTTNQQYKVNDGFWTAYTGGRLSFSENASIYARSTHPSGVEISDSLEIVVPWAPVENIENSLIPDPYLNDEIRKIIGKAEGDITKEDLAQVRFLGINGSFVRSLEGVQYCTNLSNINIANNPISDLSPIENLTKMTSIIANDCLITDISPISGFTLMEHLALSGNPVRDFSPLASMTKMNYLELTNTYIEDITALSGMTSLERLYLWQTNVVDISPLANCVNLYELYLSETNVTDCTALAGITTLTEFEFAGDYDGRDLDLIPMPANIGTTISAKINIEAILRKLDLVGDYRLVLQIVNDTTAETYKVSSDITNIR